MQQRYVWHYLHNSSAGRAPLERIAVQRVQVPLPDVITGAENQYVLAVNEQDQRTLVAFDGYLLAGSPKRKGACIFQAPAGILQIPKGQFYTPESDVLGIAPYVTTARVGGGGRIRRRISAWVLNALNRFRARPLATRYIAEGQESVALEIYRYFLLLRAGTFVFAGYDAKNLAPRYLVARVHKGGSRGEWVDWLVGG